MKKRNFAFVTLGAVALAPLFQDAPAHAQGISIPTSFPTTIPTIPGLNLPTALPTLNPAPMLGPLAASAMHSEVRNVLDELIGHLPTTAAARVKGIPLKLDPTPTDMNAYAGCDAQGKPFLAGTEALLHAIFAIA
jgi:hypothetical protein